MLIVKVGQQLTQKLHLFFLIIYFSTINNSWHGGILVPSILVGMEEGEVGGRASASILLVLIAVGMELSFPEIKLISTYLVPLLAVKVEQLNHCWREKHLLLF